MELLESDVKLIKNIKKRTCYYYVQSVFKNETFKVMSTEFNGTMIDCMRMVRFNFFLKRDQAERVCKLLNQRYSAVRKEALKYRKIYD